MLFNTGHKYTQVIYGVSYDINKRTNAPIPGFSTSTCPHPPGHSSYPNQLYQQLQQQANL